MATVWRLQAAQGPLPLWRGLWPTLAHRGAVAGCERLLADTMRWPLRVSEQSPVAHLAKHCALKV